MPRKNQLEELAYQLWEEAGKLAGQEPAYYLEAQLLLEDLEEESRSKGGNRSYSNRDEPFISPKRDSKKRKLRESRA